MTDEVLADLEAKIAAHEAHAENMRRNHGVTPNGMLVASATVTALVAEVRRLRGEVAELTKAFEDAQYL